MLLFIGILSLAIAAYLAGEVATYPARQQRRSVQRAAGYGRSRTAGDARELLRRRERAEAEPEDDRRVDWEEAPRRRTVGTRDADAVPRGEGRTRGRRRPVRA